jgi:predicted nuclease of predicted toxin-antitoxin system
MILLDRSLPRSVARALQQIRPDILWFDDAFPADTPDAVWLARAGRDGWLVVTRDKRIRHRPAERQALREAGAGCFVLTARRNLSRDELYALLERMLERMVQLADTTPRPFLYGVDRAGRITRLL